MDIRDYVFRQPIDIHVMQPSNVVVSGGGNTPGRIGVREITIHLDTYGDLLDLTTAMIPPPGQPPKFLTLPPIPPVWAQVFMALFRQLGLALTPEELKDAAAQNATKSE